MAARSIPVGTKVMCALCGQDITGIKYAPCHANVLFGGDGCVALVCIECWNQPKLLVEAGPDEDFATDCRYCGVMVEWPAGTVCERCDDFRCDECHRNHDCPQTFDIEENPQPGGEAGANVLAGLRLSDCRAAGIEAAEMWAAVVAGDICLEPDDPRGLWDEPPLVPWREVPVASVGSTGTGNRTESENGCDC